jgi:murein DD-endopeptidase MepM/ murein hydrolase activator NlpD
MRWVAGLALAFAICGSACAQESDLVIKEPYLRDVEQKTTVENDGTISVTETKTPRLSINCIGVAQQGGAVLCQTSSNAKVKVARSEKDFYFENADKNGQIIIGFDRDETKNFVEVAGDRVSFDLKPRQYDTSRIDGLPPSQVSTFTEAQLKRIRSSSARKKVGFSSRAKEMGFKDGFDLPIKADFIKTTNFGAQRILNGEPKKPHYGVDLAAPVGTPIYAPADGIVSLADDDLYFEGAMVLLDHGQGLISMYLHTDSILVEPGQTVKQGEQIATVGSKGRSTGPHLCWRLKWRNRNLDPLLLTEWPQEG